MASREEVLEQLHDVDFTNNYRRGESGMYYGYCVEVPEARSQGETLEEYRENLLDALAFMLEDYSIDELRDLRRRMLNQHSEHVTL